MIVVGTAVGQLLCRASQPIMAGKSDTRMSQCDAPRCERLSITYTLRALVALSISCAALITAAQPSANQLTAEITDNVAMEYAECAAFFAIVEGAFQNAGKTAAAEKYKEASDKAAHFSLLAAQASRSEEMAANVTVARFELSLKDMMRTIQNNYSNISLLSVKHSDSCVQAMTDSAAVMRRWTEKITSKHQSGVAR